MKQSLGCYCPRNYIRRNQCYALHRYLILRICFSSFFFFTFMLLYESILDSRLSPVFLFLFVKIQLIKIFYCILTFYTVIIHFLMRLKHLFFILLLEKIKIKCILFILYI